MVKNVIQIKGEITINVSVSAKNPWKNHEYKKDYIWNPVKCICKTGEYLESIIGNSVIGSNEVTEMTRTIPSNFKEKKTTCKLKKFLYFTHFLINYHVNYLLLPHKRSITN